MHKEILLHKFISLAFELNSDQKVYIADHGFGLPGYRRLSGDEHDAELLDHFYDAMKYYFDKWVELWQSYQTQDILDYVETYDHEIGASELPDGAPELPELYIDGTSMEIYKVFRPLFMELAKEVHPGLFLMN